MKYLCPMYTLLTAATCVLPHTLTLNGAQTAQQMLSVILPVIQSAFTFSQEVKCFLSSCVCFVFKVSFSYPFRYVWAFGFLFVVIWIYLTLLHWTLNSNEKIEGKKELMNSHKKRLHIEKKHMNVTMHMCKTCYHMCKTFPHVIHIKLS